MLLISFTIIIWWLVAIFHCLLMVWSVWISFHIKSINWLLWFSFFFIYFFKRWYLFVGVLWYHFFIKIGNFVWVIVLKFSEDFNCLIMWLLFSIHYSWLISFVLFGLNKESQVHNSFEQKIEVLNLFELSFAPKKLNELKYNKSESYSILLWCSLTWIFYINYSLQVFPILCFVFFVLNVLFLGLWAS